jgi:hypothetical protein
VRELRRHSRLDARCGNDDHVDRRAETIIVQHGLLFRHAVNRLEHAEWLIEPAPKRRGAAPARRGTGDLRAPRGGAVAGATRGSHAGSARRDPGLTRAFRSET